MNNTSRRELSTWTNGHTWIYVVLTLALAGCGGEAPVESDTLSQDFYGRWQGRAALRSERGEHETDLSVGVSVNGTRAWVNDLCPSYVGTNLEGGGHGEALTARGTVVCPPAPFGSCPRAAITWTTAEITLTSTTTSHLIAVGYVNDCEEITSFTAEGDLQRVSH